ncbi:MAG: PAC2 family protein [Caldilineaceae bacterium]|nr:PAC2 family protein [Caldilineaceae bacterium]
MHTSVKLWQKPSARKVQMIAGWHQWADAGSISSGLPPYLIEQSGAQKIGEIEPSGFYLFQLPGTHHLLRREVTLKEGFVQSMSEHTNEFFYSGDDEKGLLIFLGEEPHIDEENYAQAFFDVVEALNVSRIAIFGGVYGAMPYDRDREVSCSFSLERMRTELDEYAVRFSNYQGGTTIGTFMVDKAKQRGIECLTLHGFVPAYEFGQMGVPAQGIRIENDYKAWYDIMRRINHMFDLGMSLSDLSRQSDELIATIESDLEELARELPQLKIRDYLRALNEEFTERTFMPLDDIWERELGNLFDDPEE